MQQINDLIINSVKENNEITRERLLQIPVEGFSTDEVKCAYKALIKSGRLVEKIINEVIFVIPA